MTQIVIILSVIAIATIAALGFLANTGSTLAAFVLGVLLTVALHAVYAMFELLRNKAAGEREQASFIANAKENLAMMAQTQRVQNLQNVGLAQQLNGANRLPQSPALMIDAGVFDDLQ
jgi:hypothetical protein